MQKLWQFFIGFVLVLALNPGLATEVRAEAPKVGRRAAAKYLGENEAGSESSVSSSGGGSDSDHVLMLGVGAFVGSKAYEWKGSGSRDNVGRASYGVTYLMERWKSMDLNLRADFNEYKLDDIHATKLSLMPLFTFPEASTRFPLYFGIGAGGGVFFQQTPGDSNISFDYQLLVGARFMELFGNGGFFIEFGMKNHLHLLSSGQFNGTAMTAGAIFSL